MGFLDWFRRAPRIVDRNGLIDFLDTRAAFLTQKGIFDYTRGLSGPFFSSLIKEKAFAEAVDESRWRNYPLTLGMVTEMVFVVLRPLTGSGAALAEALRNAAFEVLDRYPVPPMLGAEHWAKAREALGARMDGMASRPPGFVKDIPLAESQAFFDALPIHERLRGQDFALVTQNLRTNLLRMHKDLTERADLPALLAALDVPARGSGAAD